MKVRAVNNVVLANVCEDYWNVQFDIEIGHLHSDLRRLELDAAELELYLNESRVINFYVEPIYMDLPETHRIYQLPMVFEGLRFHFDIDPNITAEYTKVLLDYPNMSDEERMPYEYLKASIRIIDLDFAIWFPKRLKKRMKMKQKLKLNLTEYFDIPEIIPSSTMQFTGTPVPTASLIDTLPELLVSWQIGDITLSDSIAEALDATVDLELLFGYEHGISTHTGLSKGFEFEVLDLPNSTGISIYEDSGASVLDFMINFESDRFLFDSAFKFSTELYVPQESLLPELLNYFSRGISLTDSGYSLQTGPYPGVDSCKLTELTVAVLNSSISDVIDYAIESQTVPISTTVYQTLTGMNTMNPNSTVSTTNPPTNDSFAFPIPLSSLNLMSADSVTLTFAMEFDLYPLFQAFPETKQTTIQGVIPGIEFYFSGLRMSLTSLNFTKGFYKELCQFRIDLVNETMISEFLSPIFLGVSDRFNISVKNVSTPETDFYFGSNPTDPSVLSDILSALVFPPLEPFVSEDPVLDLGFLDLVFTKDTILPGQGIASPYSYSFSSSVSITGLSYIVAIPDFTFGGLSFDLYNLGYGEDTMYLDLQTVHALDSTGILATTTLDSTFTVYNMRPSEFDQSIKPNQFMNGYLSSKQQLMGAMFGFGAWNIRFKMLVTKLLGNNERFLAFGMIRMINIVVTDTPTCVQTRRRLLSTPAPSYTGSGTLTPFYTTTTPFSSTPFTPFYSTTFQFSSTPFYTTTTPFSSTPPLTTCSGVWANETSVSGKISSVKFRNKLPHAVYLRRISFSIDFENQPLLKFSKDLGLQKVKKYTDYTFNVLFDTLMLQSSSTAVSDSLDALNSTTPPIDFGFMISAKIRVCSIGGVFCLDLFDENFQGENALFV